MGQALDGEPFPPNASTLVGVTQLAYPEMLIEISAIAVLGDPAAVNRDQKPYGYGFLSRAWGSLAAAPLWRLTGVSSRKTGCMEKIS